MRPVSSAPSLKTKVVQKVADEVGDAAEAEWIVAIGQAYVAGVGGTLHRFD